MRFRDYLGCFVAVLAGDSFDRLTDDSEAGFDSATISVGCHKRAERHVYHSDVPGGSWKICAEMHDQQLLLNTCRWADGPVVKITAGGGSAAVPAIRFQAGAKLHIRLSDDAVEFRKSGWSGETPVFGIPMVSGFVALPMVGSDAGGRDFEILVPFGMTHRVMAMSKCYSLADE